MKKYFILPLCLLLAAVTFTSCSDDNGSSNTSSQDTFIESVVNQYVNNVIYPTYSNLASEGEELYTLINNLKTKLNAGTTVTEYEIKQICETYKSARNYWEESEAFLFGAASDFEIDPHIDTWPLDVPTLAADLSDDAKIAKLNASDGISYARTNLTPENLGFHGIEFIFFRDGKNRSVSFFNNNETESYTGFSGKNVTAKEEVIFAAAVAGDLRDKLYQLEVSWLGSDAPSSHVARVAECAKTSDDFSTTVAKNGWSFGKNLSNPGSNSTYSTWKKVLEEILYGGCSNICAEVADQKMGQAYRCATGSAEDEDDPNYIESPYSYNSFKDFYDNIISIKNSLYGYCDWKGTWKSNSIMGYLETYNEDLASELNTKLEAALSALLTCLNSGTAFVQNPGATNVGTAINAVSALDDELVTVKNWILKN